MSSRPWTIALCAWTGLVWTARVRNIWNDDALTDAERWSRSGLALSFSVLALTVVVGLIRRASWLRPAVLALAGWTTAVWIVRAIGIATADHEAAFIAVHLVLAATSIALAVGAVRELSVREPSSVPERR